MAGPDLAFVRTAMLAPELPPASQRGDIARALFYMATRYTGDTNNEPVLALTDTVTLIQSTNANMGRLATLLAWHQADPVDAAERLRNDRVYSYQTNRNPFVDHPEWIQTLFVGAGVGRAFVAVDWPIHAATLRAFRAYRSPPR